MSKQDTAPVVEVAKERLQSNSGSERIVELPYGVRAKLIPVPASLIDEVTNRIKEPDVPMWRNEDKGRDEPNPDDPTYIKEVAESNRERGLAALDAMAMFGLELIDGLPEDETWIKKLKYMERRSLVDLSSYDLNDEMDKEFLFKRFIAADTATLNKVSKLSGITPEEVSDAERSFRD